MEENNASCVYPHTSVSVCLKCAQPLHNGMLVTHAPLWALFAKSPTMSQRSVCVCVCKRGVTIWCGVQCGRRCSEMVCGVILVGRGVEPDTVRISVSIGAENVNVYMVGDKG